MVQKNISGRFQISTNTRGYVMWLKELMTILYVLFINNKF